jgi:hypothetical protein
MAVPSSAGTVSRRIPVEDEDQRTWIFRDSQTPEGIQRALGVESYEDAEPGMVERDSVAVIQEYFDRRRGRSVGDLTANGSSGGSGGAFSAMATPGGAGLPETTGALGGMAARETGNKLYGESTFVNTINSESPTLRRYFRDLYTAPESTRSRLGTGASGSDPNAIGQATDGSIGGGTGSGTLRQRRLDELVERAGLVRSLSEPADGDLNASLSLNSRSTSTDAPANPNSSLQTVNEGNLFERRNGVIEIPGRKF